MERLRMERHRKTLIPNWKHVEWKDSEWKDSENLKPQLESHRMERLRMEWKPQLESDSRWGIKSF
jgi:hypothetical protein